MSATDTMKSTPAGRRAWILAASLLAIIVINAMMAFVMSREIADRMITHEATDAQIFINRVFRTQGLAENLFQPPHPNLALSTFAGRVAEWPDTIRLNIYSPDRFIRYSSQAGLTGVKFEDVNSELNQAFSGELVASLETLNSQLKAEHTALPLKHGESFIEAYIPVSNDDGKVFAVVELYQRSAKAETVINGLKPFIWLSAGLGGLILFAALSAMLTWGERKGAAAV
jgi:hypothetical protein